jgi:hypothetical protein
MYSTHIFMSVCVCVCYLFGLITNGLIDRRAEAKRFKTFVTCLEDLLFSKDVPCSFTSTVLVTFLFRHPYFLRVSIW